MGLVLAASQSNGLVGANLQPWHLKASYKLLDLKGKTTEEGTIEEFWAGHHKRRITYTGSSFTQSTYWTGSGTFQVGPDDLPSDLIGDLRGAIVEPMPSAEFIKTLNFEEHPKDFGTVVLSCVTAMTPPSSDTDDPQRVLRPTYCLNTDKPVLRVSVYAQEMRQALLNRVINFQGRFVAQDVRILQKNSPAATLQVDLLEVMQTPDDLLFTPPSNARPIPPPISVLSGTATGVQVTQGMPRYPALARSSHISGTVVIKALIGKNGKIASLTAESGPYSLQQAALDAAKGFSYWPFFDDGEPVEVSTKLSIVFSFAK